MKKVTLAVFTLILTACAKPPVQYQSQIPLDMRAVQEYEQRVTSGKTAQPAKMVEEAPQPLNQSDRAPKVQQTAQPVIYPSIGIGYHRGWGHPRRH